MAHTHDDPAARERYVVAPRQPGPDGVEALRRLDARVREIPGARAVPSPPVPGLTRATPRLLVSLPRHRAAALQAEFGAALIFDVDAGLDY